VIYIYIPQNIYIYIYIELQLSLFCCLFVVYVPCFGGSPSEEAAKTRIIYIKKQYILRLTKEHMSLYSSVNRGIYGHVAGAQGALYSLVLRNIKTYIRQLYIHRYIHRLIEEYKLYSLV
jgi:hypothetical protein